MHLPSFLLVLILHAGLATTDTPCLEEKPDCGLRLEPAGLWAWVPYLPGETHTVTAATVVTVINKVLNTTATSTITNSLPSSVRDLPPVETNAAGTRIETVVYTIFAPDRGSVSEATTVITYPSPFLKWPDYYAWAGWLTTEYTVALSRTCHSKVTPIATATATATGSSTIVRAPKYTVFSTANPQPTTPLPFCPESPTVVYLLDPQQASSCPQPNTAADPTGGGYYLARVESPSHWDYYRVFNDMWKNDTALWQCDVKPPRDYYDPLVRRWSVESVYQHSTRYETDGAGAMSVAASVPALRPVDGTGKTTTAPGAVASTPNVPAGGRAGDQVGGQVGPGAAGQGQVGASGSRSGASSSGSGSGLPSVTGGTGGSVASGGPGDGDRGFKFPYFTIARVPVMGDPMDEK